MMSGCMKTTINPAKNISSSSIRLYRIGLGTVINNMIQSSDGGYVVCGDVALDTSGKHYAFLMKTDAKGNIQWQKEYALTAQLINVRQTSDGGYIAVGGAASTVNNSITRTFFNQAYLLKTDAGGNVQWQKTYGDTSGSLFSDVTETSDHGYIAAGTGNFPSTVYKGAYNLQMYAVKTDQNGKILWQNTYQTSRYVGTLNSICNLPSNVICLSGAVDQSAIAGQTGYFYPSNVFIYPNGNQINAQVYTNMGLANVYTGNIIPNNNGILFAYGGYGYIPSKNTLIVYQTDFSGNILWYKHYKEADLANLNGLTKDGNGGYYITGTTYTTNGPFVMDLDASGNVISDHEYAISGYTVLGTDAFPCAAGTALWLQFLESINSKGYNFGLMFIDKNGNVIDASK